jgi:hypothetical protein
MSLLGKRPYHPVGNEVRVKSLSEVEVLGRKLSAWRANLWKVGAIPYNAVVGILAAAVLIQSRVWKIRKR